MKRFAVSKLSCIFFLALLSWVVFPSVTMPNPAQEVSLLIDHQPIVLPQPAIVQDGRVMVPLRGVFEALGATVHFDPMLRLITATRYGNRVLLSLDSREAEVNGKSKTLDAAPMVLRGSVMVPLRFVSEALGAIVRFEPYIRTANILSRTGGIEVANPQEALPPLPTPTVMGHFIKSMSLSPATAAPGENIVVTMNATTGSTAVLKLSNGDEINMREALPGYYITTYTVPNDFQSPQMNLTVEVQTPDGGFDTFTQTARIER